MLSVDELGNINLTRGDTGIFNLNLTDSEGDPYVPHEDDVIVFSMAKVIGDPLVLQKDVEMPDMVLRIDPEDTKQLAFGSYHYDLQLTDYEGKVTTVLLAKFTLTKEVG